MNPKPPRFSGESIDNGAETYLAAEAGIEAEVEESERQHDVLVEAVKDHLESMDKDNVHRVSRPR